MKEAALTKKIRLKLKEQFGGCFFKMAGGPYLVVGLPDLIGTVQGYFIAIEVKLPGKEDNLTDRQALVLKDLTDNGKCLAFMTSSVEDAVARVSNYLKTRNSTS